MRRIGAVTVLAAAALAVAGCGGSSDEGTETVTTTETAVSESDGLTASVGPGFEISMVQSEVAPGSYTLTVDDQSSAHNFHLTGPGVDVSTDVSETGTETFTVDLEAGSYTFVCDPHSGSMNGTLTVG